MLKGIIHERITKYYKLQSFDGNSDVTIKANCPQAGRKPKETNQSMNANIRYIKLHLYMDKLPRCLYIDE